MGKWLFLIVLRLSFLRRTLTAQRCGRQIADITKAPLAFPSRENKGVAVVTCLHETSVPRAGLIALQGQQLFSCMPFGAEVRCLKRAAAILKRGHKPAGFLSMLAVPYRDAPLASVHTDVFL